MPMKRALSAQVWFVGASIAAAALATATALLAAPAGVAHDPQAVHSAPYASSYGSLSTAASIAYFVAPRSL